MYTVKAVLILDNDGERILAKVFEKKLDRRPDRQTYACLSCSTSMIRGRRAKNRRNSRRTCSRKRREQMVQ